MATRGRQNARSGLRARAVAVLLVGVVVGMVAACGGESDDGSSAAEEPATATEGAEVQLEGRNFVSEAVTGHELVRDSALSLAFEDGVMALAAGCNTMFGGYEAGDRLRWADPPASTQMACDAELTAQDEWLFTLFSEGLQVVADDGAGLVLESGDVRLTFTEAPDRQSPA